MGFRVPGKVAKRLVEVGQTGAAGGDNIKLYPDADGHVGRIEINGRNGGSLGVLTRGATGLAIRPGAGGRFAATPLPISPQQAARDQGFVRQLHAQQIAGRTIVTRRRNEGRGSFSRVPGTRPQQSPAPQRPSPRPPGLPKQELQKQNLKQQGSPKHNQQRLPTQNLQRQAPRPPGLQKENPQSQPVPRPTLQQPNLQQPNPPTFNPPKLNRLPPKQPGGRRPPRKQKERKQN